MRCLKPITAWYGHVDKDSPDYKPGKKAQLVFTPNQSSEPDGEIQIPCGKCIECFWSTARDWAVRSTHEVQMHGRSCFITLTISDDGFAHREKGSDLCKKDLQHFFKRLRRQIDHHGYNSSEKIRYYACGEYGSKNGRAHYHALIFGYWPHDAIQCKRQPTGDILYDSEFLEKTWGYGMVKVGTATFQSAGYIARYCAKKSGISGLSQGEMKYRQKLIDAYRDVIKPTVIKDPETGIETYEGLQDLDFVNEFQLMSRNPGLGKDWYEKYGEDIKRGYVIIDKKKMPIPKYYLRQMKENDYLQYLEIIDSKKEIMLERLAKELRTDEELIRVRQVIANQKQKQLVRTLEAEL